MEGVGIVFIFIGVTALTALLFGGWVIFTILRLIMRGLIAIFDPRAASARPLQRPGAAPGLPPLPASNFPQGLRCSHEGCHQMNPTTAHFCRRCGRALPTPQRVGVRRAAMW
jgi:hypothetical protein